MRVFTWGSNFSGQLCAGYRNTEEILLPLEVKPFKSKSKLENIKRVIGGRDQTYFIFINGSVYGCGINNCGQLGGKLPLYVPKPTQLHELDEYKIKTLSARGETIYAITYEGICLGWGSNSDGQLGISPCQMVATSKPIKLCDDALQVSAGGRHVAIISGKHRKLLTCGAHKHGEIGRRGNPYRLLEVDLPPISTVSCGEFHTIAVTTDGDLYGWGMNLYGQTGSLPMLNKYWQHPKLVDIDYILNPKTVMIASGREHNVLYEKGSELLTWGRNQYGQISALPHEPEFDWKPTVLYDMCHVKSVAIGGNHNVVCLKDNDVHFWGWTQGKCIPKFDHKHKKPFALKAMLDDLNVCGRLKCNWIAAGEEHSMAIVQEIP